MRVTQWALLVAYLLAINAADEEPLLKETIKNNSTANPPGIVPLSKYANIAVGRDGIYVVPTDDDTVSMFLSAFGEYEYPYVEVIMKLFPTPASDEPPLLFLDIGANIGTWTIPLARHIGERGRMIAFEAVYETSLFLGANVVINGLQNVAVMNVAVTDCDGISPTIAHPHDGLGHNLGSFALRHFELSLEAFRDVDRRVFTTPNVQLDHLYDDNIFACPDFIKMDIEMHELHALRGGLKMIQRCHPIIFLEHNCIHLSRSIITLLDKLGYSMAWFVAPMLTENRRHFGRSPSDFAKNPTGYLAMMSGGVDDGGVNIIAIPTSRAEEIFSDSQFSGTFVPIFMGYFDVEAYNIEVCVDTSPRKCRTLKMDGQADDTLYRCAGINMLEENVFYWREVEKDDFLSLL